MKIWNSLLSFLPLETFASSSRQSIRSAMAPALTLVLLVTFPAGFSQASAQKQAHSHADDFLIFATIFDGRGFALPGARVRVRRADEKKFRWEAISDRRGELGIRVKQGAEYEVSVEARGFMAQTRHVDAREGKQEELTLQLEPLTGGKR
jgi:hypothetical protein